MAATLAGSGPVFALPVFSLQVPLAFSLNPLLTSPPPLPRSNVVIENSTTFTLGSFAPDGAVIGGDAALVILIANKNAVLDHVAVHASPAIEIGAGADADSGLILAGASGGGGSPSTFIIGFFEFEIDFAIGSVLGDHGAFDVGLALLKHQDQPLSEALGVAFVMDVFLGATNTDNGVKFPSASLGGAAAFTTAPSVPEPSSLTIFGLACVGLLRACRRACARHAAITRNTAILVVVLAASLKVAACDDSASDRDVPVAEQFPGPWLEEGPTKEKEVGLIRALVKNRIRGCGMMHWRESVKHPNEFIVECASGTDLAYDTAYLVYVGIDHVLGPYEPDPSLR
ncbi:MAG: PEP-CTERM sorting domain-containing protein [Alphaproteobacteria bacterium]